MLSVTILGNNSAIPAFDRHPTAQVVTLDEHIFLVDCGEGTQMQMTKYKIRRSRINHIFISHLHGDHYFGLIGLVTSMGLLGRQHDLHLHAPPELREIFELQLRAADVQLPYRLLFHALGEEGTIVREQKFEVDCFKVYHRIPCWGFLFREVRAPRRVNPDKARQHDIPSSFFDRLKWGDDYITKDGRRIGNELATDPAPKPRTYAFAADTRHNPCIADRVRGVDLLYHETTYLAELQERAEARFHSTTRQAADIARLGGVKKLLIGHFSSKYERLEDFVTEAKAVFPDTELAIEGVTYRV